MARDTDLHQPAPAALIRALARIEAQVATYNSERPRQALRARLRQMAIMGGWLAIALVGGVVLWDHGNSTLFGLFSAAMLVSVFWVWEYSKQGAKRFQQGMRDRLLPALFGYVDTLSYAGLAPRDLLRAMPGNEFVRRTRATHGDMLSGSLDGFSFTLAETELAVGSGSKREVTFLGVAVRFAPERAFPGTLIAAKRPGRIRKALRRLYEDGTLVEIHGGEAGLDEDCEVRSDNVAAAGERLAGLAEALDGIAEAWPEGAVRIAIRFGNGYLLAPTDRDLFELPPLGEALDVDRHLPPMIDELTRLVAMARLASRI